MDAPATKNFRKVITSQGIKKPSEYIKIIEDLIQENADYKKQLETYEDKRLNTEAYKLRMDTARINHGEAVRGVNIDYDHGKHELFKKYIDNKNITYEKYLTKKPADMTETELKKAYNNVKNNTTNENKKYYKGIIELDYTKDVRLNRIHTDYTDELTDIVREATAYAVAYKTDFQAELNV